MKHSGHLTWGLINTYGNLLVGEWTTRNPSYFGFELQGTGVLTHSHIAVENGPFIDDFPISTYGPS